MSKAMLIDTTLCIGCRGCQVSCKSWNNLPGVKTTFSETGSNPRVLGSSDYTRVIFREVARKGGGMDWYFVKRQCMHCNEPACASVCKMGALKKLEGGPVVCDDAKCNGCRDCMAACPFQIPKFKWGAADAPLRKCTFCADRQAMGLQPACATTCPTQALLFGDRSFLLEEAKRRIDAHPEKYVHQVYGEKIVGGTSKLYLTSIPFDQMGLQAQGFRNDLGDAPCGKHAGVQLPGVPYATLTLGGLCLGLNFLNRRRAEVQASEKVKE